METAEAREQTKKAANEIKMLRSELRLSAEEMKTNGTSLEGLQKQYRLLEDETKFWFDGKPSGLVSALCKTQSISQEEADKIREMLNDLDG